MIRFGKINFNLEYKFTVQTNINNMGILSECDISVCDQICMRPVCDRVPHYISTKKAILAFYIGSFKYLLKIVYY